MTIQLEVADAIRYASFLVNAVVAYYWLKQRLLLNNFLAGRWEGVLHPSGNPSAVYKCVLYMANRNGNDNSGYLYYCKENLNTGDILVKGLDELVEYDARLLVFGKEWCPRFVRVFHKESNLPADVACPIGALPKAYIWNCEILAVLFSAKMRVKITEEDQNVEFVGILRKH